MNASPLEQAIAKYETALIALETALKKTDLSLSSSPVLEVLIARHSVQTVIDKNNLSSSKKLFATINRLDQRLKKQVDAINQLGKLSYWRDQLNPPENFWWWFLDSSKTPWWDRYDWLWSGLSATCLAASLSLMIDISSRFLSGGPDPFGTFAVISQTLLALLTGGSTLTKTGQEALKTLMENFRIPKIFWHEAGFSASLLLLLGLGIFHQTLLPKIADKYNSLGEKDYAAGKLSSAENKYNRALKLYPDHAKAHYNLGVFYESLQDSDRAGSSYQIAVKGGYYQAATNLSRLYILKGDENKDNYSKAISWLSISLPLAQNDPEIKYTMLTNLGWARLGQQDYVKAENHLKDAISLQNNRAPAYCLLAQVLEKENKEPSAEEQWGKCIQYANQKNPDEDTWLRLAREHLQAKGEKS